MTTEQNTRKAPSLETLLASSYTLYLKTHNFHWNVTGPTFVSLHTLFEEQYQELATAVDDIAEGIRAMGRKAPGSYREFSGMTKIEEANGDETAEEMIKALVTDHETICSIASTVVEEAEANNHIAAADLATQRVQVHNKTAWMLKSLIQ